MIFTFSSILLQLAKWSFIASSSPSFRRRISRVLCDAFAFSFLLYRSERSYFQVRIWWVIIPLKELFSSNLHEGKYLLDCAFFLGMYSYSPLGFACRIPLLPVERTRSMDLIPCQAVRGNGCMVCLKVIDCFSLSYWVVSELFQVWLIWAIFGVTHLYPRQKLFFHPA